MPSETVWNDAFARASAVAEKLGLLIGDPLTWDFSSDQKAFAALDLASSSIERLELGDQQAQESGQICIMLWIPQGKMNTPTVLSIMNAFEAAFRTQPVDPDKRWPAGLFYEDQNYTPPSFLAQTGNWYVATLMVDYRWQNITEQTP